MEAKENKKRRRDGWVISLTPDEIQVVDQLTSEIGMTKQEFVRRIFSWFAKQDDLVQKVILRVAPQGQRMQEPVAEALRQIADEIEGQRKPIGVIRG